MTADQFVATVRETLASGKRIDIQMHEIATALADVEGLEEIPPVDKPVPVPEPAVEGADADGTVPLGLSTSGGPVE